MTSRNNAVYWYHNIFEMVYYGRVLPNTVHPYAVPKYTGIDTTSI